LLRLDDLMTSYTHGRHIAIPEKSVFRLISRHLGSNTTVTASAFHGSYVIADHNPRLGAATLD
jgi:hypothetical protein